MILVQAVMLFYLRHSQLVDWPPCIIRFVNERILVIIYFQKKKHAFNFHESVHGKKTRYEGNVLPSYTRIVFEVKYNCVGFYPQNHKDQHCSYVDSAIDATTKHCGWNWPRDLQPNQRSYDIIIWYLVKQSKKSGDSKGIFY